MLRCSGCGTFQDHPRWFQSPLNRHLHFGPGQTSTRQLPSATAAQCRHINSIPASTRTPIRRRSPDALSVAEHLSRNHVAYILALPGHHHPLASIASCGHLTLPYVNSPSILSWDTQLFILQPFGSSSHRHVLRPSPTINARHLRSLAS